MLYQLSYSSQIRQRTKPTQTQIRAGEGNRTLVACLEGRSSTIELHPQSSATQLLCQPEHPPNQISNSLKLSGRFELSGPILRRQDRQKCKVFPKCKVGSEGFEPSKRQAQQIYSLRPLATWITPRISFSIDSSQSLTPTRANRQSGKPSINTFRPSTKLDSHSNCDLPERAQGLPLQSRHGAVDCFQKRLEVERSRGAGLINSLLRFTLLDAGNRGNWFLQLRRIRLTASQASIKRASEGTRTLNLRFTKPLLCQLSYAGLPAMLCAVLKTS